MRNRWGPASAACRCPSHRFPSTSGYWAPLGWCNAEPKVVAGLYRLDAAHLQPLRGWIATFEHVMEERLDQMDAYLEELQHKENASAI